MKFLNKGLRFIKRTALKLFSKTIDLRDKEIDISLIESLSKYNSQDKILLSIPIGKCVTSVFWKLDESNPFIKSLQQQDINQLKEYYLRFQPNNVNELLAIYLESDYGKQSPYAYVMPWETRSPRDIMRQRDKIVTKENKKEGYDNVGLINGGHSDFGPVSSVKFEIEKKRIQTIYKSIKQQGYQENLKKDRGINGYFLMNQENKWCFYITGGKHRAYVLSALKYNKLPVVVRGKSIVDIKNYTHWAQYKERRYSKNEIEIIFNKFFD